MSLIPPKAPIPLLAKEVMDVLGDFSGGIRLEGREAAFALIEKRLIRNGSPLDRLRGAMTRAFLRMEFPKELHEPQKFEQALERFLNGDYQIGFDLVPPAYQADKLYIQGKLDFPSDINAWALRQAIADQLAHNPLWMHMAKTAANWCAFFLRMQQDYKSEYAYFPQPQEPLRIVKEELRRAQIQPFDGISIMEFAGPNQEKSSSIRLLLPGYASVPAGATDSDDKHVSLASPGMFQFGTEKIGTIIAQNVFCFRSRRKAGAYHEQANLLCVMASTN